MSDINKKLGIRLRELRESKRWTQEELALRAEISTSHMGRLERGERGVTLDSLEKVTKALGISFEELFRFIDSDNKDTNTLYKLVCKLSKRSIEDQRIISDLIDVLPPWKSE
ncbi:TPA: helix-turn-helix domain-containing protein [Clostridium botulinum]|uniref:helix-turn-helix domain-containing protein n=1 Tax=Clostridium botulinum TaxID=1491 RepID=UPI001C9AB5C1|nr:helix-turn-helix transcriptional regulator [Clostridium botulinum]MBY6909544.1 helix-turn-helix transcriptional regulator [Clostridium botulinum]